MKTSEYKPSEVYSVLKNIIKANDKLIERGEIPISFTIEGVHGTGKTTIVREIANELGRGFFKLNLAQIQEPAELQGYFSKEYKLKRNEETVFVTENMLPKFIDEGWHKTDDVITKPCPPDWVYNLKENSILCFDDMGRQNSLLSQAIMEILNEQYMIGWDLKGKKIQIICTNNPDNGEYNVTSSDGAQSDRYGIIRMKWDAQDWAERAEKIKLDERLINFVLWQPELLENKKSDGVSASNNVSPRMMDKFFSLVSTIDDFEKNLDVISKYANATVGDYVGGLLTTFIHKRLDKLPSISDLFTKYSLEEAKEKLKACCGDSEKDPHNHKSATAAILATRLLNYVTYNSKSFKKDDINRYLELLLDDSFSEAQKVFLAVRSMNIEKDNRIQMALGSDPRVIKYVVR